MVEFRKGQKSKLADLTPGTDLYVGVRLDAPGLTFDISCFGLDTADQLSDDRYFVFFNQPKSPEESIQLLGEQAGDQESFRITLDRVPPNIGKLAFTATIDGDGTMAQVASGHLRIAVGGQEVVRYGFTGAEFSTERAIMIADLYRKDVWRFAAVGQGFDGGLKALLENFGGEALEEEKSAAPQQAPAFAPPPPAPAPPQAQQPAPQFQAPAANVGPQGTMPMQAPPMPAPQGFPPGNQPPGPPQTMPMQGPPMQHPPMQGMPQQPAQQQGFPAPPAGPGQFPPPPGPGQFPPPGGDPQQGQFPPPGMPAPTGPAQQPSFTAPAGSDPSFQYGIEHLREVQTQGRWVQQNHKMVKATVGGGFKVIARQGVMVAYQGEVKFKFQGQSLRSRFDNRMTGQSIELMRCEGDGEVFLAEDASNLHLVDLQGSRLCVNNANVLAYDEGLQIEPKRIESQGIPGGGLFVQTFSGNGTVVVKTKGDPLLLPVQGPTFADSNAIVAWTDGNGMQVSTTTQVRLRRTAYPGHSGETVNLQFRGPQGHFIVVQPYEV